jgi:hypothetical protein
MTLGILDLAEADLLPGSDSHLLFDFFAIRDLRRHEERLHPFAFAADRHA